MQGQSNVTLSCFVFDVLPLLTATSITAEIGTTTTAATNSTLYIEGVYEFSTKKLNNVRYVGMTSSSAALNGTQSTTIQT
jgi:hypothetical protein